MKKQFLLGACLLWAGAFTLQAQNTQEATDSNKKEEIKTLGNDSLKNI